MDRRVRRSVLGAILGIPLLGSRLAFASDENEKPDAFAAGRWMDEALVTRASNSPLRLQRFADPVYILLSDIVWTPNKDQVGFPTVVAPRGFVTDLASIPRVFWIALRPDADYAYAAIIHDFLYWQQALPKDQADLIFKMSMEDFQLSKVEVAALYYPISHLGNFAWRNNAQAKARGERRILRKFPPDARTTWQQWKARGDVFAT